jgi:hypothetical protein
LIIAIEVLTKTASASFEAPSGPILLPHKLTEKDDEKEAHRDKDRNGHTRYM